MGLLVVLLYDVGHVIDKSIVNIVVTYITLHINLKYEFNFLKYSSSYDSTWCNSTQYEAIYFSSEFVLLLSDSINTIYLTNHTLWYLLIFRLFVMSIFILFDLVWHIMTEILYHYLISLKYHMVHTLVYTLIFKYSIYKSPCNQC